MIVGRRVKQAVLGTGATLTLLTGLIGFAHTPAGRPMLQWIAGRAAVRSAGTSSRRSATPRSSRRARSSRETHPPPRMRHWSSRWARRPRRGRRAHGPRRKGSHASTRSRAPALQRRARRCAGRRDAGRGLDGGLRFEGPPPRDRRPHGNAGGRRSGAAASGCGRRRSRSKRDPRRRRPAWRVANGSLRAPSARCGASFHYADRRAELTATNFGEGRIVLREIHQIL